MLEQNNVIFENEQVIILGAPNFPAESYKSEKKELAFVCKLRDAICANPKNPIGALLISIGLELLDGTICSARVTEKHRVILIARHFSELNKLVLYFLKDDPLHKYRLDRIIKSCKSQGYSCGSDAHWKLIFDSINLITKIAPEVRSELAGELKLEAPLSIQHSASNNVYVAMPSLKGKEKEKETEMEEPDTQEIEEIKLIPDSHQFSEIELKKKKNTNKNTPPSKNEPKDRPIFVKGVQVPVKYLYAKLIESNDDTLFESMTLIFIKFPTHVYASMSSLLNLGINPSLCDLHGRSLLDFAIACGVTDTVRLLLERGASLIYQDFLTMTVRNVVTSSICSQKIEKSRGMLKILFQKMKENGTLDNCLVDIGTPPIFWAIAKKNYIAIEEISAAGGNLDIKLGDGTTAVQAAQRFFAYDRTLLKRVLTILLDPDHQMPNPVALKAGNYSSLASYSLLKSPASQIDALPVNQHVKMRQSP